MKLDSAVFYTNDIKKIVDFYTMKMGLEVDYVQDDKFASFLFENGVKLGIKKARDEREIPGKQTVFISAPDVYELFEKFKSEGYRFYKEIEELDWGVHFSILDPDENKIVFIKYKK
jgi:predicted enzyme related to lactoylglutathione lyase